MGRLKRTVSPLGLTRARKHQRLTQFDILSAEIQAYRYARRASDARLYGGQPDVVGIVVSDDEAARGIGGGARLFDIRGEIQYPEHHRRVGNGSSGSVDNPAGDDAMIMRRYIYVPE